MRYPEFTDKSGQSKWEGKFSREGFERAAHSTQESSWLSEYEQSDLDFINSELEKLGGVELLDWANINAVSNATARRTSPAIADAVSVFDMSTIPPLDQSFAGLQQFARQ